MRAPLPNELQSIREMGDTSHEYWRPAYNEDSALVLDPGEELLWTGPGKVDGHATQAPLPGSVAVTTNRVVWACTGFDKGGGWVGFGLVGFTVAQTANVVSRQSAKKRSQGRALAGHVRYEWLVSVAEQAIRSSSAAIPDRRLVLACAGSPTGLVAILHGGVAAQGMVEWVAQVAAAHRARFSDLLTEAERAELAAWAPASLGTMAGPKNGDWTRWAIPGEQGLLIAAAYADYAAAAQ